MTKDIRGLLIEATEKGIDISPFNQVKKWYKNSNRGHYHADKYCIKLLSSYSAISVDSAPADAKNKLCTECVMSSYPYDDQKLFRYIEEIVLISINTEKQISLIDGTTRNAIARANLSTLEKKLDALPEYENYLECKKALKSKITDLLSQAKLTDEDKEKVIRRANLVITQNYFNRKMDSRKLHTLLGSSYEYSNFFSEWSKFREDKLSIEEFDNIVSKLVTKSKPESISQLAFEIPIEEHIEGELSNSDVIKKYFSKALSIEIDLEVKYFEKVYNNFAGQKEPVIFIANDKSVFTEHYEKAAFEYFKEFNGNGNKGYILPKNIATWLSKSSYDTHTYDWLESDSEQVLEIALTLWEPKNWSSSYRTFSNALQAARAL